MTNATRTLSNVTGPQYGEPRDMPWSVMGTHLKPSSATNLTKALADAGLDYEVRTTEVVAVDRAEGEPLAFGTFTEAPKARAIVRPVNGVDTVIGISGTRFRPIQNRDAFGIATDLCGDFGAKIDGLADFRHGGASVMALTLPEGITLHTPDGGEDATNLNLLVKNHHDGSGALSFMLTPVRMACTNVLPYAAKNARMVWKVSHTPNADQRHALAVTAIKEALGFAKEFTVQAQAMVDTPMVDAEFAKIVAGLWKVDADATGKVADRKRDIQAQVMALYQESPTLTHVRGTRWGGYNALTEYLDHFRPVKGGGEKAQQVARAEGQIDGPNLRVKTNLFRQFAVAV